MKKLVIIMISLVIFAMAGVFVYGSYADYNSMDFTMGLRGMNSMKSDNMMSGMMSQIPQNVIVKVTSGQTTEAGKEAKITLLVLDKETKKPLSDAQVIIGIEKGASMTTMNMIGSMFNAEDVESGKYVVRFTLYDKGYYTMHTHVIPDGKSMHSMMNNHLDIGILVA